MRLTRVWLIVAAVAPLMVGCTELEKKRMELRGQLNQNIQLFGTASTAFAGAADEEARKKHDLQRQLIRKVDEAWLAKHTGADGKVSADAAEMAKWIGDRDAALVTLAQSEQGWKRVSGDYRDAVNRFVTLSQLIYERDLDAQRAEEELQAAGKAVVNLLMGAGTATAIAVPAL